EPDQADQAGGQHQPGGQAVGEVDEDQPARLARLQRGAQMEQLGQQQAEQQGDGQVVQVGGSLVAHERPSFTDEGSQQCRQPQRENPAAPVNLPSTPRRRPHAFGIVPAPACRAIARAIMLNKGLLLALAFGLLAACDASTDQPATTTPQSQAAAPVVDGQALARRYAGQPLKLLDASELQRDGAAVLSLTFSVPLDPDQPFSERLHLVDSKNGRLDGAWSLSDNLMELSFRPLEPERKLVLTLDAGLRTLTGERLAEEQVVRLTTRPVQPSVGFASRGSLLPSRLAEGLPVIALNVDRVDVEFFRIRDDALPR